MNAAAITTFLSFTALVAVISWWKTRTEDLGHSTGYFLAGRSLPWFVVAGSLMLTNISTEQLVGLNGDAFTHGACVMAWEVIASVTMVAMALYFLPRYLKSGITTVPQFLEARFGRGIRSLVALMFLVALTVSFLPFVLYSGALALDKLFGVGETFGISDGAALWIMVIALGVVGGCYAVFGGLKAVAVSDTINGAGLILGGFLIPVLAMLKLGDGSMSEAMRIMTENKPEMLSPIGGEAANVPFTTLFTGILIINMFYWCTNQAIVQRTFGAKNLAESQKGVLCAAFLKILGVAMLVLPGIIAYHLNAKGLIDVTRQDMAYPLLVSLVLPAWLTGFFGAVMFGAILSSFNSGLNSVCTLFSVDIYKQLIRKNAPDAEMVWAGKLFGAALIVVCILLAPLIAEAPEGLYTLMRKTMAFFNIPILAIILMGVLSKRAPALGAYLAVPVGILFYGYFGFYKEEHNICDMFGVQVHWLHVTGINLLLMMTLMLIVRLIRPTETPYVQEYTGEVDLTFWKGAKAAGVGIVALVILVYWWLGQFGGV